MQVLRRIDARTDMFPFATLDYETGGRRATEHLLALGLTRIAFVGGLQERPVTEERMAGYRTAMAAAELERVGFLGRASRAFGRDMALGLLEERPGIEAAICFSDLVALGMLAGFAQTGVRVGADFRLVGFDDIEECALAWPQLSSVRCDVARFGRDSAEGMLAWIEEGIQPPETRLAPVKLIVRMSSGGAPAP
jgi:LacI family transcriptional regulator